MTRHTASRRTRRTEAPTPSKNNEHEYNKERKPRRPSPVQCFGNNRRRFLRTLTKACLYAACAAVWVLNNNPIAESGFDIESHHQRRNLADHPNPLPPVRRGFEKAVDGARLMAEAGFENRPRMVRWDTDPLSGGALQEEARVARIDPVLGVVFKNFPRDHDNEGWREKKSRRSDKNEKEPSSCELQHDWQKKSFPTCNAFHEQDMTLIGVPAASKKNNNATTTKEQAVRVSYVAAGNFRDVWRVFAGDSFLEEPVALKTLVYREAFSATNLERHRRDAVANERLSSSRFVPPYFGACANSALVEFAGGGTLRDILREWEFSSGEKCVLAYHAAAAVSDVHNIDKDGRASLSHTDIKPEQFVYSPGEGILKLTDFNRCRFISWDKRLNQTCPFRSEKNIGKNRSPEEYRFRTETEKSDVYMLGNILYTILTGGRPPFEGVSDRAAIARVREGAPPPIDETFLNSTDASYKALAKAISMAWEHDPAKRASSAEVRDVLRSACSEDTIFF